MAWNRIICGGWDNRRLGIAAILVAVLLLSMSDALVKLSGDRFGLGQIVLLRSLVASAVLALGLGLRSGMAGLRLRQPLWVWLRSLCLAAMWLCYYAALPSMTFSLAAACYYLSPVWMALMGQFVLGSTIDRRGWTAIALSVAGVVLAVNPRAETMTPALLLPLAAGGFYALAGIITYRRCRDTPAGAMALNLNICLCMVAACGLVALAALGPPDAQGFVLAVWPDLGPGDWGLAIVLGLLLAIITVAVSSAYRLAPTPVIGLFDTAYLGFAALWSALFFARTPTPSEAFGLATITIAACLMNGGSDQRRRAGHTKAPPPHPSAPA